MIQYIFYIYNKCTYRMDDDWVLFTHKTERVCMRNLMRSVLIIDRRVDLEDKKYRNCSTNISFSIGRRECLDYLLHLTT